MPTIEQSAPQVVADPAHPLPVVFRTILRNEQTDQHKTKLQMNAKAKYLLTCALSKSEYDKIISCDSAKEIWDRLQVLHKGTNQVKETKISMLVHQYEMFKMLDYENIDEMTTRFMHVINQLKALGKVYLNAKMVKKILRSLSKAQRPKVTAIQEAKDLNVLSLDALIGSLKTHEIELNETSDEVVKKGKSMALRSSQKKTSSSKAMKVAEESEKEEEESSEEDEDCDEIAHLAKRISKAWFRRKKKNLAPKKDKRGKLKQDEIICFECKEPGHIRSECPRLKKVSKKKITKKKAMMATWEDLDEDQENAES